LATVSERLFSSLRSIARSWVRGELLCAWYAINFITIIRPINGYNKVVAVFGLGGRKGREGMGREV
jgi:hypothetical protein